MQELFRKTSQKPSFDFDGEIVSNVFLTNIEQNHVVLIKKPTINHGIYLISVYVDGKRVFGTRFEEKNCNFYKYHEVICWVAMQTKGYNGQN